MLDKLAAIQMLDVHFPTTDGRTLILSRYTEPDADQNSFSGASASPCRPSPRRESPLQFRPPATATRHVVETFDRPALIPLPFLPARISS